MQKFLVVDDHRLFLEGMRHLLAQLGDAVSLDLSASVSDALLKIDQGNHYELLLLDIQMPEMDGFSLIESLNQRNIVVPIILVSSTTDFSKIRRGIELGASGFINKNASVDEMLESIKTVLAGGISLPEDFSDDLEVMARHDDKRVLAPTTNTKLGDRQREVLHLIDTGLSNKQIANVLSVSKATVKYHIRILFRYFEVRNRTACLAKAREQGII